jgi:hypothetical protein
MRPLEPLALPEYQWVRLTIEDPAAPQNGVAPVTAVNERREEFQWLAEKSGPSAGQRVALDGSRLVAHGDEPGDLPFGGWQAMHRLTFTKVHSSYCLFESAHAVEPGLNSITG